LYIYVVQESRQLHNGVGRISCNTAVVITVARHQNVATETPCSAPAVLHDVEIGTSLHAIADSGHTVIKLSRRAGSLIVHSASVELEGGMRSINGHRDRPNGSNRSGEVGLGSGGDIAVRREGRTRVASTVMAAALNTGVGIRSFGINATVADDVLEGVIHQTAIASIISLSS